MLCKKFYNLVYFTTNTLYKSKQMSCDNSVDLRLQTLHDWVKLHIIKIILLILGNVFNSSQCGRLKVDWTSCKKDCKLLQKDHCWIVASRQEANFIPYDKCFASYHFIYHVNGQNVICMWLQFEWPANTLHTSHIILQWKYGNGILLPKLFWPTVRKKNVLVID